MDYNATVNLPKTAFPMRAGLPAREPGMLKSWYDMDLYHEPAAGSSSRMSCGVVISARPSSQTFWRP